MEVILLQKIANLGDIGDRVRVKPGFGRNHLLPGGKATLATPEGHTTAIVPMHGRVVINDSQPAGEAQLALLERTGGEFTIGVATDATVLLLSGEPLKEPVVGYGPFVMTSEREIAEAIRDYQGGRFGQLTA